MEIESVFIDACITIFSLGLLIISLFSYRKYKNTKLLFVSLAFFVFFIRGILLSLGIFEGGFKILISSPYMGLLDLAILILLFMATLKR